MLWYASSARICATSNDSAGAENGRLEKSETCPLLERLSLFQRQAVALGDDGHDIDNFAQLFHDENVDRLERVSGRGDKVETAVDSRVDNVLVSHRGQFFAQVRRVLILDVFDDRIPAARSGREVRSTLRS